MLLTEREKKVLRLLMDGQNSSQIAKELGIRVSTVKSYTARVVWKYRRFGFRNLREVKEAFDYIKNNKEKFDLESMDS